MDEPKGTSGATRKSLLRLSAAIVIIAIVVFAAFGIGIRSIHHALDADPIMQGSRLENLSKIRFEENDYVYTIYANSRFNIGYHLAQPLCERLVELFQENYKDGKEEKLIGNIVKLGDNAGLTRALSADVFVSNINSGFYVYLKYTGEELLPDMRFCVKPMPESRNIAIWAETKQGGDWVRVDTTENKIREALLAMIISM